MYIHIYLYICICVYIYIYINMYIFVCICMYMYIYIYIYVYIYIYIYIYTYIYVHTYILIPPALHQVPAGIYSKQVVTHTLLCTSLINNPPLPGPYSRALPRVPAGWLAAWASYPCTFSKPTPRTPLQVPVGGGDRIHLGNARESF